MTRAKHPQLSETLSALAEALEDYRRSLRRVAQAGAVPSFASASEAEAWATDFAGPPPDGWAVVASRSIVERTDEFGKPVPVERTWGFGLRKVKKPATIVATAAPSEGHESPGARNPSNVQEG